MPRRFLNTDSILRVENRKLIPFLRTFASIASAHPYCARHSCRPRAPRHASSARAENGTDKYSAGGRFNNLARILLSWMHGDPCFSFHRSLPLLSTSKTIPYPAAYTYLYSLHIFFSFILFIATQKRYIQYDYLLYLR